MDIQIIRAFTLLAEHLHYGRTAELLNLTQPALTKQIHRLEAKLGVTLFERGTHGTKLTTVGQMFLLEARNVIQDFDRLLAFGQQSALGQWGRLRIGFGVTTINLVSRLVVELRKSAPNIVISLKDMSTTEQLNGLREEQLDIGFVRLPVKAEFNSMPIINDRMVLITSEDSPLPKRLALADCHAESFILISREASPTCNAHSLALCAQYGFHPRIIQESTEFTTILALVRTGLGVSLIPESYLQATYPGIRSHIIPDEAASWSIGATWRKRDSNPALKQLLILLKA
jgi:DNA-binding transcriptional LysR family regulator